MHLNRAVVISLLRRRDRLEAFKERYIAAGRPVGIEFVWGEDGEQIADLPMAWHGLGRSVYGQYLSHLKALEGSAGPLLVLEDDAVFAEGFRETLRNLVAPAVWDVIYLGGELAPGTPPPTGPVRSPLVPVLGVRHPHAYLVRDPGHVAGLLRARQEEGVAVAEVLQDRRLHSFALLPFSVGQGGGLGSDIREADREDDTFWQPRGLGLA